MKKTMLNCSYLPVLFFLMLLASVTADAIQVKGIIDSDSQWQAADSPIFISDDILVSSGATLTIDPGVSVIFLPRIEPSRGYNLIVEGTLTARANGIQPIVFTAEDRNMPWGSIIFRDTSADWETDREIGSILRYCVVEYGGHNPDTQAMIVSEDAMPMITHSTIRFSRNAGISATATETPTSLSNSVHIIENHIYRNGTGVVLIGEGGSLRGNYFLNNIRAVNVSARSRNIDLSSNTIVGNSDELFGSAILLNLNSPSLGIASYHWEQTAGPAVALINANSATASFIAPDPGNSVHNLTFSLAVTSESGSEATDSVDITVIGSNEPPVADAGGDAVVRLSDNPDISIVVTLDGTGSTDPDFYIAAYAWIQESGTSVALQQADTATPSFIVPESVAVDERMAFKLTVADDSGLEDSDTMEIRFYRDNLPPQAIAGADTITLHEETVVLDGTSSRDDDGGIGSYLWTQTEGPAVALSDANTPKATFQAPSLSFGSSELTFELTVQDTGGLSDTDDVSVTVIGALAAEAGENATASAGGTVILDAGDSIDRDASADIRIQANAIQSNNSNAGLISISAVGEARYSLQISGNNISFTEAAGYAVYLSDWAEATAVLEAVENYWGTFRPADIDTMIYDGNDNFNLPIVNYQPYSAWAIAGAGSDLAYPPVADAGPDIASFVDVEVTLDGSNSYDPDSIGRYQWQQIDGSTVVLINSESQIASFITPPGGTEGQELRFRLTMTTPNAFSHWDEAIVTVNPDEPAPIVETGGCFIRSSLCQTGSIQIMGAIMLLTAFSVLCGLLSSSFRCKAIAGIGLFLCFWMLAAPSAYGGFLAIGAGDGGNAESHSLNLEIGAVGINAGNADLLFAVSLPFIPHEDENVPVNTISLPCPNNACMPLEAARKGTEVGFIGKLGLRIATTNFYFTAISGFTVYTESHLSRSAASGFTYEDSTDTTVAFLYGGGLSYFPEHLKWPIFFQIDYDVTRGIVGSFGWQW